MLRLSDPDLVELVDAVVSALDTDRCDEVARVRDAFGPFDGAGLFDAELRLSGYASTAHVCCFGECLESVTAISESESARSHV